MHSRGPKTTVLNVSSESRTVLFVLKIKGETKPAVENRFIRDLSAVYQRNREPSSFLAAGQCTDVYFLFKIFSYKACSRINIRIDIDNNKHYD